MACQRKQHVWCRLKRVSLLRGDRVLLHEGLLGQTWRAANGLRVCVFFFAALYATRRDATRRDGIRWDGIRWDPMGSDGMGSDGMGSDGIRWDGIRWDPMGWDPMGWDGMGCTCLVQTSGGPPNRGTGTPKAGSPSRTGRPARASRCPGRDLAVRSSRPIRKVSIRKFGDLTQAVSDVQGGVILPPPLYPRTSCHVTP